MYKKVLALVAFTVLGVLTGWAVTKSARADTFPGDSYALTGTYQTSGFTSNAIQGYDPCTALTAQAEGWWAFRNGQLWSSGSDSTPDCGYTTSPDSVNPGETRYDFTFTYTVTYSYLVPPSDAGHTVNLELDINAVGNSTASVALVVSTPAGTGATTVPPPPPTTTTQSTTIDPGTTTDPGTTVASTAPPAPSAPAPSTSTVTVTVSDPVVQDQLNQLEQEYAALDARVTALETASVYASNAYYAAKAAGASEPVAVSVGRSTGTNFVYSLGQFSGA